jgi:hypothetical protein
MDTYAQRLKWAMNQHKPPMNQSDLARAISMHINIDISPQSIQHLCDIKKNAKGSNHNSIIAEVLSVNPLWLAYNIGEPFFKKEKSTVWPFSITAEQYQSLEQDFRKRVDRYVTAAYEFQRAESELFPIGDVGNAKKTKTGTEGVFGK